MFKAYLSKEWREQKWSIIVILGAFLPISMILWSIIESIPFNNRPSFIRTCSQSKLTILVGLILAVVVLANNLLGREMKGHGFDFLSRVPGRLGLAFTAKMSLWAGTVIGIFGLCYLSQFLPSPLGFWPAPIPGEEYWHLKEMLILTSLGFVFGLWVMASAAWMDHQGLALPATIVFIMLWWAPFMIWFYPRTYSWSLPFCQMPPPDGYELTLILGGLLLPSATLAAWLTLKAKSFSSNTRRPMVVYFSILLAATCSSWGWHETRKDKWTQFNPDRSYSIDNSIMVGSSPYLFTNIMYFGNTLFKVILDTRNGDYEVLKGEELIWDGVVALDGREGLFRVIVQNELGAFAYQTAYLNDKLTNTIVTARIYKNRNSGQRSLKILSAWNAQNGKALHLEEVKNITLSNYSSFYHRECVKKLSDSRSLSQRNELSGVELKHYFGEHLWLGNKNNRGHTTVLLYDDLSRKLYPTPYPDGEGLTGNLRYSSDKRIGKIRLLQTSNGFIKIDKRSTQTTKYSLWDWETNLTSKEFPELSGFRISRSDDQRILFAGENDLLNQQEETTKYKVLNIETNEIINLETESCFNPRHMDSTGVYFGGYFEENYKTYTVQLYDFKNGWKQLICLPKRNPKPFSFRQPQYNEK